MFCSHNDESVNNLNLSTKQYLDILAPPLKEEQFSKANIPSHTTSLSYIRTLPLLDQVRILMKDGINKFIINFLFLIFLNHQCLKIS
jgi:DNA-directed RNA polymerase-3 subunit RPC5